jgi:hypothetical protein
VTLTSRLLRLGIAVAGSLALALPGLASAACPTAENVAQGFLLHGGSAASEVRHFGERFVQARTAYPDGVVQTDLYYDGIFAISRVSPRGAQMMYDANLSEWQLDLEDGATSSVTYIPIVDSKPLPETTLELQVKGRDEVRLGSCSYEVFVIAQTRKSGESSRAYDQLYSPLLKFVIARRYPDGLTKAYRGIDLLN